MNLEVVPIKNHKVYVIKNFNIELAREEVIQKILEEFEKWFPNRPSNIFNFLVPKHEYFDLLYYKFYYLCHTLFPLMQYSKTNSTRVYAYVNNKYKFATCIHNHLTSCDINGVYYLSVPKINNKENSRLMFYDGNETEIGNIQPQTNDLLIFGNDLFHRPCQSSTEESRIALNMEIKTKDNMTSYFRIK